MNLAPNVSSMFKKGSAKSLKLNMGDEVLHFSNPSEFDFALSGRICVPSSKIVTMVNLADDALLREAEAIRKVEQKFAAALSGSLENVTTISPFLKEIDLALISQDNDWRSIVSALNATDEPHEEYKTIALVKYMQYLTSRQEVVRSLYANRHVHGDEPQSNGSGGVSEQRLKETVLFDFGLAEQGHKQEFARVPKGETIEIPLDRDSPLNVRLAKHHCFIVARDKVYFVDETGKETALHNGKNIVGRDARSDVIVDASHRDVSRKHLILEALGLDLFRLTDISSHGTSIDPMYLDHTDR